MKADEFITKYGDVDVNGREYQGAPIPPFEEESINEGAFVEALRFKSVNIDCQNTKDRIIIINWISQEWSDYTKSFYEEIKRCYSYLMKKYGVDEDITVRIDLRDRNHEGYESNTILIEGQKDN